MKIEYNKKSIVRFRDLKAGDLFCEIDKPAEEIMMKTVDVFRPDCSMLNAVYLSDGEFKRFGETEEVEPLPNATLVNRSYGVANEN